MNGTVWQGGNDDDPLAVALGIVVFGSFWGLAEATLGGALHAIHFADKGGVMGSTGMAIMGTQLGLFRKPCLLPLLGHRGDVQATGRGCRRRAGILELRYQPGDGVGTALFLVLHALSSRTRPAFHALHLRQPALTRLAGLAGVFCCWSMAAVVSASGVFG